MTQPGDRSLLERSQKMQAVARILKARFNSLTVEETIDLSVQIVEAVERPLHIIPKGGDSTG